MKELYVQWLRLQCESWMKEHAPELFQLSYSRVKQLFVRGDEQVPVAEDECLISQIAIGIGPWEGICFHFKEPGEIVFPLEKCNLSYLREQGNLVLIVRCLEDFKMLAQTYFCSYLQAAPIYAAKFA